MTPAGELGSALDTSATVHQFLIEAPEGLDHNSDHPCHAASGVR